MSTHGRALLVQLGNDRKAASAHGGFDLGGGDGGCLVVLLIALAAFAVAALFRAAGGFAAPLAGAFEVAFAGTGARGPARTRIADPWACTLWAKRAAR